MTYPYSLDRCAFFDRGLKQQPFDLAAGVLTTEWILTQTERATFASIQNRANYWTYIGSGRSHPRFLETLGELSPRMRQRIEGAAALA